MNTHSIVPVHLAVKAMRDNGYKNAAYAIAELIDNSIQAEAKKVELMCSEVEFVLNNRTTRRVKNIAILDNGIGMDSETLRVSLQFGNGTNLTPDKQKGIGKFGMGLPSASISQAKRVEVWTWQNGFENALYSYLDLNEITSETLKEVPLPKSKNIPQEWVLASKGLGDSGTLVVWSDLDKCIWKTASAIFKNSEFVIGRMYRYYIESEIVTIRMVSFMEKQPQNPTFDSWAEANDPLYLMDNTACPAPYNNRAMFREFPCEDSFTFDYPVEYDGTTHIVKIKYSLAKEEARVVRNAGALPHGKHAAKNIGISLVRANRELDLDDSICIKYDPVERWWGIEISFPPALDEVFGVTNNKQYANNFSELAHYDLKDFADEDNGDSFQDIKQRLEEDEDPKGKLITLVNKINTSLKQMRQIVKKQGVNRGQGGSSTRHTGKGQSPEEIATETTNKRIENEHIGTSDEQENEMSTERRINAVREVLIENDITGDTQESMLNALFNGEYGGIKYQFINGSFDGNAFFSVKPSGGKIIITLNMDHPAYDKLIEVLNGPIEEDCSLEDLKDRLSNASDGLKLLLMAWARYEDEEPDGERKKKVQNARQDWGRIADEFLRINN